MQSRRTSWDRLRSRLAEVPALGLTVDTSRVDLDDEWLAGMAEAVARAHGEMALVEAGEAVNTDEGRMVGHYWLRDPARAPSGEIRGAIESTLRAVKHFAADVHAGAVRGSGGPFTDLVVVGIGGSALGPQLVAHALGGAGDRLRPHFIDNTDPDGIDRCFAALESSLGHTLVVVISKSGGTKETRNGMLEAEARYRRAGLDFSRHAVAVTGEGSELDRRAEAEGWITRFPMWDWIGGRTSETSAVGLLPAALQGLDLDGLLEGARLVDEVTRRRPDAPLDNPALALALAWHRAVDGRGAKDMVILPYKDRLELMARYLQQLVMESLGKERDREGRVVHQGIAVYGNKGSTDQHAYVQQLRDGVPNFFATFIEVLRDREGPSIEVEPGVTSGDFLHGFLLGTRRALHDSGRASITITLPEVSARTVGGLIALYERAVGFYAAMVRINAYHQPGVEAGKRAAAAVIALQRRVIAALRGQPGVFLSAVEVAEIIDAVDETETVWKLLQHLAANPGRGVVVEGATNPLDNRFKI